MLKNIRRVMPFWLTGTATGRKTAVSIGPNSLSGGIDFTINLRENGKVSECEVRIVGTVENGKVVLKVWPTSNVESGFVLESEL